MTTYFVSRHPGALDWAARQALAATPIAHLNLNIIKAGDVVIGTLPIQHVAAVNKRGARYFHLEMDIPADQRGANLSADDMERFGAKLVEYEARAVPNTHPQGSENDRNS